MPGKILRRCTICKKFHASYLLDDPKLGKYYLCYSCWRARSVAASEQQTAQLDEKVEIRREASSPHSSGNSTGHNESG
jgi:hypothetical protein